MGEVDFWESQQKASACSREKWVWKMVDVCSLWVREDVAVGLKVLGVWLGYGRSVVVGVYMQGKM